jgi:hypothetical protein
MRNKHILCLIPLVAILQLLASCGGTNPSQENYGSISEGGAREFDEDEARDRAEDDLSNETYASTGAAYGCTGDCEGHEAGFRWAKEHSITDGSCNSNSDSFDEGCQAYADAIEEKVDEYRDEEEEVEE